MGADIHLFTEAQQPDGSWEYWNYRPQYKGSWLYSDFMGQPGIRPDFGVRNYFLFSLLGDVRNHVERRYSLEDTLISHDFLPPIVSPRGIPQDAGEVYKFKVDVLGPSGHSHSYLTLEEMLHYPWTENKVFFPVWLKLLPGGNKEVFNDEKGLARTFITHGYDSLSYYGIEYDLNEWREHDPEDPGWKVVYHEKTFAEAAGSEWLHFLLHWTTMAQRCGQTYRFVFFFDN